jgi:hypothetical protein
MKRTMATQRSVRGSTACHNVPAASPRQPTHLQLPGVQVDALLPWLLLPAGVGVVLADGGLQLAPGVAAWRRGRGCESCAGCTRAQWRGLACGCALCWCVSAWRHAARHAHSWQRCVCVPARHTPANGQFGSHAHMAHAACLPHPSCHTDATHTHRLARAPAHTTRNSKRTPQRLEPAGTTGR